MSARCPDLPFLPGYTFNPNIGRTKFNMCPKFDFIGPGNRALVDRVKPNLFGPLSDKYPSIYPRGETVEIPSWIAFDKKILVFDAYFQETLQEVKGSPYLLRKVKIYLFLEDGTIQVIEPRVVNSGVAQGTVICRQKIRFPPPMDDNFYDILDFNIGREVELYGRVFKIVDCDKFTRTFLNRCGIGVPDPITMPVDPFMELRKEEKKSMQPKKCKRRAMPSFAKFIENDKKVLNFRGYWDDQKTLYGYVHHLDIRFYLADDTLEITEIPSEPGGEPGFLFLKRAKLPKINKDLPPPGYDNAETLLNVLGNTIETRRYILDSLDAGRENVVYYMEKDLTIGAILNVYGRQVVLVDCDSFTKEYYAAKYGINEFTPIAIPDTKKDERYVKTSVKERELPPWNGYGSYEDSAQNCITVEPKAPFRNFKKFLKYDRDGMDSRILRFKARMISKVPENCDRNFIVSFYLSDDNIAIHEVPRDNTGFPKSCFLRKHPIALPDQKVFTSKPPQTYTPQHMFVGATVILFGWTFVLIDADEYALRYMEVHSFEFPKSNIKLIMDRVREKLRPIYKDFVAENVPKGENSLIPYEQLRTKLCAIMGPEFTEQEMITIARAYSGVCYKDRYERNQLRAMCLTELKRFLYDELDRLGEYFKHADATSSGTLSRKAAYTVLRACRLPLDKVVLEKILDVAKKDQCGNIIYDDILEFLNRDRCPPADIEPVNIKYVLWWASEPEPKAGKMIDWCGFHKALNLEDILHEAIKDLSRDETLENNN